MQDVVLYGTNKGVNIVIFMFTVLKKIKSKINGDVVPIIKMCFYNTVCKAYIKMFGRNDRRNMKYKLSFCLIFKNEGPFLKEWLDYHIVVGVDHFYLYNNNSDDNFREVLEPYIKDGIVTLIEWPYDHSQFKAYKHCYDNFRSEFASAATSQFGSGWAWLAEDKNGKLQIMKTANGDNPVAHGLIPIIGLDVWEHAYYLDYQNRRVDYINNYLNHLIKWN